MTLYNLVRCNTATLGTGSIIVGSAVSGYKDFTDVPNGATVSYGLRDIASGVVLNSEVGSGTWTSATSTLSRDTVYSSTNSGNKISLATGTAEVYLTALAENFTAAAIGAEPADATIVKTGNVNWIDLTDGGATTLHSHAGGIGTGTAGNVVKWGPAGNTLVDAALIPPATNILTINNAAAATVGFNITAGKILSFLATDTHTLTINSDLSVQEAVGYSVDIGGLAHLTFTGASTLATNISFAKTLTLTATDNYNATFPMTGTVAMLQAANVFTATQAIQGTVPALQFLDTTAAALNGGIFVDGNTMYFTNGIATNGTGVVMSMQYTTPYNVNFYGTMTCIVPTAELPRLDISPSSPSIIGKNSGGTSCLTFAWGNNDNSYINPDGASKFGIGTSAPSVRLHVHENYHTAANTIIGEVLRLEITKAGATGGGTGFGPGLTFYAETATNTTNQQQAQIAALWTDATNATRKAKLQLSAYDTAQRIGIEIEASGSVAQLGFFGHATAAQPAAYTPSNVTPDRSYDANSTSLDEVADVLGTLIADLQTMGLIG